MDSNPMWLMPLKEEEIRTQNHTVERPCEDREDNHPQQRRGLRGNQACWHFDIVIV